MSQSLAAVFRVNSGFAALQTTRPAPTRRLAAAAACAGMGLLAAAAAWQIFAPETTVTAHIVGDGGGASIRTALAELALRFAAAPSGAVQLSEGGTALLVSARDRDPAAAQRRVRAMADAILDARLTLSPAIAEPVTYLRPALLTERARLLANAREVDAQSATLSVTTSAVARDLAAASRATSDRRPGKATAETGAAALADLQIARFQLLGRYQADFPAVLALDVQIKQLRSFLAEEARRAELRPAASAEADALLLAERDRLRHEATNLDSRRSSLQAALTAVDARLAEAVPAPVPHLPPIPVLIEAATTQQPAPDQRALPAGALALAGLLSAGLLLRRRTTPTPEWTLVPTPLAAGERPAALLPPGLVLHLPLEAPGYRRS